MSEWKPVAGFDREYEVSDDGLVRSAVRRSGTQAGRILRAALTSGYPRVVLSARGRKVNAFVHQLVAAAFVGPRPDGLQINHKNGTKTDCRVSNLEYLTAAENSQHAIRTGLARPASGAKHSRLTADQVREIRALRGHLTQATIARRFGVSSTAVNRIQLGLHWVHEPFPDQRPVITECAACGVPFERASTQQRYCTRHCYRRQWKRAHPRDRALIRESGQPRLIA